MFQKYMTTMFYANAFIGLINLFLSFAIPICWWFAVVNFICAWLSIVAKEKL